jgi:hypothetical protein
MLSVRYPNQGFGTRREEQTMSLTIEIHELNPESTCNVTPLVEGPSLAGPVTVERWLHVMYGIRPDAVLRARFVPITHRYEGGEAEWLERMWGIRPGVSFPTSSTAAV